MFFSTVLIAFLAGSQLVAGHGAIIAATGNAGGSGSALGIDPSTPRNGSTKVPFEQDTTKFKGASADVCGSTKEGGVNNIQNGTAAVLQQNGGTLPQITAGGSVNMTLHQVNGDGAGPYSCMIDAAGTGKAWKAIKVTTQVAGTNGKNKAGEKSNHALAVTIPANQTCTGTVAGQSNVCMVRCQNTAKAGPFGGCVPVQMGGSGNSTAAAAPAPMKVRDDNEPLDLVSSAKFRRAFEPEEFKVEE